MHCTQCGAEAEGRFCASCGASLKEVKCGGCGVQVPAGNRFCTNCGTPVGGGGGGQRRAPAPAAPAGKGGMDAGWWVAGGLLIVVLVFVGISVIGGDGQAPPAAGAPASAAAGGTPPDLSTMTPREAADRLFNRVMTAAAREDTAEANSFLPMALDAYELAKPLNEDGLFHLSLLQRASGQTEEALATAQQGLETNPDHLLDLSAAAEAALQLGDSAAAREYYERLVEAWDGEMAAGRPEYDQEHATLMPLIREEADTFLAAGQ